jgi:hypothetical protein
MDGGAFMSDMINEGTASVTFEANEEEEVEQEEGNEEGGEEDSEEDKNDDTQSPMWKALEVHCLCDAWKVVSIEPITSSDQTSGTYGKRNKTEFTERLRRDVHISNQEGDVDVVWNHLTPREPIPCLFRTSACGRRATSTQPVSWSMHSRCIKPMSRKFKLMHCFIYLKQHEKCRHTASAFEEGSRGRRHRSGCSVGHLGWPLDRQQEGQAAATQAASLERVTSCINKWQAMVPMQAIIQEAKGDKRLACIMEKHEENIELERTRLAMKKRKKDLMIMTADTSNIDDKVKAAHLFFHDAI